MRATLPVVCLLAAATIAVGQLPSDGRASYARDPDIRLKFEVQADKPADRVELYFTYEGGAWQRYDSVRNGQRKEFIFKADRDGQYEFATMTIYRDGSSDPPSKAQLTAQKRTIVDRTRPKILSLRSTVNADGSPGIEWDVSDEHLKPKGIELMYKWPDGTRFEPIDVGVPFSARDHRHWQLRPNERMQVKLVATDWAGNRTESDPVWVSAKDGVRSADVVRDTRPAGSGASAVRDAEVAPAGGRGRAQVPLHYVNNRAVALNSWVTVGPSGLKAAYLYVADDKLIWKKELEEGPKPAPEANDPDKERKIPLPFVYSAQKDGLFNFIIIAQTHRGTNYRLPVQGDPGHVQVIVDTLKPVVEILETKVAPNGDRGAVVNIKWRAQDANIAPIPIKLEYKAVGRGGDEWKAITPDWIDNTGQHTWTPPGGGAYEFLIRVTCKDRAGNEGSFTTKDPVNVDLAVPQVHVHR
ncbi:MAG TPA: hypothetical protein VM597_11575, partial [Gemmataceae bacterium]|nr:hypothetical protein [Gemmataceae bacterium]